MSEDGRMRDYLAWHEGYDDPGSSLSRRLAMVQRHLRAELDRREGPVRVVSVCAGDGRDVLGVLAEREDAGRVGVTLVEVLPELVERARAAAAGLPGRPAVAVRQADAGTTDAYAGAVPADVLLLVGVLGNISDDDLATTLAALPQLVAAGGTVVWSNGHDAARRVPVIRGLLEEHGFTELAADPFDETDGAVLGVARFDGRRVALVPGRRLFTFVR
jgi:SAM-dependent methyltransferase